MTNKEYVEKWLALDDLRISGSTAAEREQADKDLYNLMLQYELQAYTPERGAVTRKRSQVEIDELLRPSV